MTDVTGADVAKATAITGCVLGDAAGRFGPPFCATHDEDGNPPWHRCRWALIAAALAEERAKARAPFADLAQELATVANDHHATVAGDAYADAADRIIAVLEGTYL